MNRQHTSRSAFVCRVTVALLAFSGVASAQCILDEDLKLIPDDGDVGDRFGGGVALEGEVAVIGAPFADNPGAPESGKAYVFRLDAATGDWLEEAQLLPADPATEDCFGGGTAGTPCHGQGVVLSGDVAVVGAHHDDDLGENSGAVHVYRRDSSSGAWLAEQKLLASDGEAGHQFGMWLDIEGDTIVVGARGVDGYTGAVYVFRYDDSEWFEEVKLMAFDGVEGDFFGQGLGIRGDLLAIGAQGVSDLTGAVYIYRYDTTAWQFEAKLIHDDPESGDSLGAGLAVDVDVVAAGAPGKDEGIPGSGAIYVFRRQPGTGTWDQEALLMASDPEIEDYMGYSVSMQGDVVVAGANFFTSDPGEVHVFRKQGDVWSEVAVLMASDLYPAHVGFAVDIDEDRVLAGAPRDIFFEQGSAYFFELDPGCDPIFRRGDANGDGEFNLADPIYSLGALFVPGAPASACDDAADANDDGQFDISDPVSALSYLFSMGPPLPAPGSDTCGPDPSADELECESSLCP